MEDFGVFVMLLCLLALVGVVIYFIIDYLKEKREVEDALARSQAEAAAARGGLDVEKLDRMANVKYIVDQVNSVNRDIYSAVTSNTSNTNTVQRTQSAMLSGLGSFLSFSSNTSLGAPTGASTVPLLNLPGSGNVDVNLMRRVNATMGLTASDLSSSKSVKFCASSDPTRCIQIPDANGNLYLTTMTSNQNSTIVMDAPNVRATGSIGANIYNFGSTGTSGTNSGSITTQADGTISIAGTQKIMLSNGTIPNQNVITLDPTTNSVTISGSNIVLRGKTQIQGELCINDTCINASNLAAVKNMSTEVKTNRINLNDKWLIQPEGANSTLVFRDMVTGGDHRYAMQRNQGNQKNL